MNLNAIIHRSALTDCYALDNDTIILNIRTGKEITAVTLIHEDPYAYGISGDFRWVGKRTPMTLRRELKHSYIWSVAVKPEYKRLQYYFELSDGTETRLMLEDDFYTEESLEKKGRMKQYFKFAFLNSSDVVKPPEWVKDTIWYQIMPDRFCRGSSRPKRVPLKDWEDRETVGGGDFYGGDLKGIIEKLPYLAEMGITGIYLLPVFLSNTNHKYNTFDYEQIDPDFGTEEDMIALVDTAHALGIRVMLDAVFNHSGTEFFAWRDVWEKGENSPYFDWFCINERPFTRKQASLRDGRFYGFAFIDTMPKLNTNHPEVIRYCADRCKYWVQNWKIDGIRFDVGNEVSHTFLKVLNREIKSVKDDVFLLGEIWMDSILWLQGDEYDAVMNYPFVESLQNFWVDRDATSRDLMYALERCYSMYPEQVNRCIFNFLDTHDTMRALNRCGSSAVFYQQLAVLMTMPGSPCIYYGTEIAMPGGHDPDCRRTMPWKEIEAGKHDAAMDRMRRLIRIRREHQPNKDCRIRWIHDVDHPRLVTYEADTDNGSIRVCINGCEETVDLRQPGEVLFAEGVASGKLLPGGIMISQI